MQRVKVQPAYVEYLEADNMMLRWQLAQCGIHDERMKAPAGKVGNVRMRGCKVNAYSAASRPPRAAKVKKAGADDKTLSDRLGEATEQLAAANVVVPDDLTARELVDLYLAVPEDLRKAVRIYAASKLVPDANIMSNVDKIALANIFKSQFKASLTHLDEEQANDVCSMLMKATVH